MVKVKTPYIKTKEDPSRFGYIILFVFCLLLVGGFGYFFKRDALKHQQMQRRDNKELLFALSQKKEEVKQLKSLISNLQNEAELKSLNTTNPSYDRFKKKVSNDLQKITIQQKIGRRLLSGKDFSIELHTLDALLKNGLDKPEFERRRRHATEGIPTTYEIEKIIRRTPFETADYSQKNWILKLFSHFLIVSSRENKENFNMLIELIRTDRMQKSIELVEEYFPNKAAWKSLLEKRLIMKRALKKLENLIFESVGP